MYTSEVVVPPTTPPCIRQSKAVYSQFQFGDPIYAAFEGLAKDKMHQTFDNQAVKAFADNLGLAQPTTARCGSWREMP